MNRVQQGRGLGGALAEGWKAFLVWSSQPFKECYSFDTCYNQNFTTVGSYDEEDMTWVEYQWLARRNYDSPRMKRPPPRLYQHPMTRTKSTRMQHAEAEKEEEDLPPTPPATPPSSQCLNASNSSSNSSDGDEDEDMALPRTRRQGTNPSGSHNASGKPRSILRGAGGRPRSSGGRRGRRVRWTAEVDILEWWRTLTDDMRQARRAGPQTTPRPWLWQAAGEEEEDQDGAVSPASSHELGLSNPAALSGVDEGRIKSGGDASVTDVIGATAAVVSTKTSISGFKIGSYRARRSSISCGGSGRSSRSSRSNSGSSGAASTSRRGLRHRYKKKAYHRSRASLSLPLHRRFASVVVNVDQIFAHAARRVGDGAREADGGSPSGPGPA